MYFKYSNLLNKKIIIIFYLISAAYIYSENSEKCIECHYDENEILLNSLHADEKCSFCHGAVFFTEEGDEAHPEGVLKAECSQKCHEDSIVDHKKGIHAIESALLVSEKKSCAYCHGSHDIQYALEENSKVTRLIKEKLSKSVHADLQCADCHESFQAGKERPLPQCENCHSDIADEYSKSVHGKSNENRDAALCYDCHGSHSILPSSDPASMVFQTSLPLTCAKCHAKKQITELYEIKQPDAVRLFEDSMHGRSLLSLGLKNAPSCNDCHGVHNIQNHFHPQSPINHNNIPQTCGKCHRGIQQTFEKSIHGKILAEGDPKGPVCITCHTSHDINLTKDVISFKRKSDEICGNCHRDKLEKYQETYHGKSIALGYGKVAACFDCHGKHDIFSSTDFRSKLFKGKMPRGGETNNLLQTCRECHPNAETGFTEYYTHSDHSDKKNYPVLYWSFLFMTTLLIGVFGFFTLHSSMWMLRTLHVFFKNPKDFLEERKKIKEDKEIFVRFKPVDRFIHALIIISFILLVITGMPLKFYEAGWAKFLFMIMGGSEAAGYIHRVAAIITIFYFLLHIITMIYRIMNGLKKENRKEKTVLKSLKDMILGPGSPVPNKNDIQDFIANQKYFFGKGPKPQFDYWTYWEKFDYLAVFWGVVIIGFSGLIMWFPDFFTSFLPGWSINIALIIHSDEALLAAGFIFTFHFFNVHLRPEKFPIDSVIFSGRITKAELENERGRYLKRLEENKELEKIKYKDDWPSWKKVIHPLGYLALAIGIILALLIYWSMGIRIFG
ncbi:MAG: cytochrome c3 family protein [Spirochaetia bacterium]|nr:cytochrome c3 family protein [Spirochaetia bacterium]